jgi:hypothetical protein
MSKWNVTLRRCALAVALAVFIVCQATAQQQVQITISRIAGTVEVQNAAATKGQWVAAKKDQVIAAGWNLRTGASSKVQLVFPKDNIVILKENSVLSVDKLDQGGGAVVNAKSGGLLADIRNALSPGSEFDVKTPNALAVVRGTKFGVQVTPQKSGNSAGGGPAVSVNFMSGGRPLPVYQANTSFAVLLRGGEPVEADVDGDGKNEVVMPGTLAAQLLPAVQKIQADAAQARRGSPGGGMPVVKIAEGDVTGDGLPDLTVSLPSADGKTDADGNPVMEQHVLRNVGDLDGDGLPEYVVEDGMAVAHELTHVVQGGRQGIKETNPSKEQTESKPRNLSSNDGDSTDVQTNDVDDNDPKRHHATSSDPYPDPPNAAAPRDSASGLATGKRMHKPVTLTTEAGDADGRISGKPLQDWIDASLSMNFMRKSGELQAADFNRDVRHVREFKDAVLTEGDLNGDGLADLAISFEPNDGGDQAHGAGGGGGAGKTGARDFTLYGTADEDGDGVADFVVKGGGPTAAQFSALIDSTFNMLDDEQASGGAGGGAGGSSGGKTVVSGKPMRDWIQASFDKGYARKNGQFTSADFNYRTADGKLLAVRIDKLPRNWDGSDQLQLTIGVADAETQREPTKHPAHVEIPDLRLVPDQDGDGVGEIETDAAGAALLDMLLASTPVNGGDGQASDVTVRGWDPKQKKAIVGSASAAGQKLAAAVKSGEAGPVKWMAPEALSRQGGGGAGEADGSVRVAVGDVNGDGVADLTLVLTRKAGGDQTLHLLGAGDVDGDGAPDYSFENEADSDTLNGILIGLLLPAVQTSDEVKTETFNHKQEFGQVQGTRNGRAAGSTDSGGDSGGGTAGNASAENPLHEGSGGHGENPLFEGSAQRAGLKIMTSGEWGQLQAADKALADRDAASGQASGKSVAKDHASGMATGKRMHKPFVITAGDVDGDGSVDLTVTLELADSPRDAASGQASGRRPGKTKYKNIVLRQIADTDGDGLPDYSADADDLDLLRSYAAGGLDGGDGGPAGIAIDEGGTPKVHHKPGLIDAGDVDGDGKPDEVISGNDLPPALRKDGSIHAADYQRGGAKDPTPATYTWTVDHTPPDATAKLQGQEGMRIHILRSSDKRAFDVALGGVGDVDGDGVPDFKVLSGDTGELGILIGLLRDSQSGLPTGQREAGSGMATGRRQYNPLTVKSDPGFLSGAEWAQLQAADQALAAPRDAASGLATGKRMHKPFLVDSGDLDGDGSVDLAVTLDEGDSAIVSPRDAASGLPTGKRMHKPLLFYAIGDVDGDGGADFLGQPEDLAELRSYVSTAREAGSGMATGRRQYNPLTVKSDGGFLSGSEWLELLAAEQAQTREAGSGMATGQRMHKPFLVDTGDLDGDGSVDLAVTLDEGDDAIVSPRDAASGLPTGKRMHKPMLFYGIGDVDGDGLADYLGNPEDLALLRTRSKATGKQNQRTGGGGGGGGLVAVGDVDGDGSVDYMLSGGSAQILIGLLLPAVQTGDAHEVKSPRDVASGLPTGKRISGAGGGSGGVVSLAQGDVNGDGVPDLTLSFSRDAGDGKLLPAVQRVLVSAGDVDGDGSVDFLFHGSQADANEVNGILIGLLLPAVQTGGAANGQMGDGSVFNGREIKSYFQTGDKPTQGQFKSRGGGVQDPTPATFTWTVDTQAPTVRASGPGGGGGGGIVIKFQRSDEQGGHQVTLTEIGDLDGDGVPEYKLTDGDGSAFGILIGLLRDSQSGLPTGQRGKGSMSNANTNPLYRTDQPGGGDNGPAGIAIDEPGMPKPKPGIAIDEPGLPKPGTPASGGTVDFFGYSGKVEITNGQGTSFLTPDTTVHVGPGGGPGTATPSGPDAQTFMKDAEDTTLFDEFDAAATAASANLQPIRSRLQRADRDLKQIEDEWPKYERTQDIGKLIILWSEALKLRPELDKADSDIWHALGAPPSPPQKYDGMVAWMQQHGVPDVDLPLLLGNLRERIDELEMDIEPYIKGNQQLQDELQGLLHQGNPALGLRGDVIDTDNDGVGDATEIAIGTDPLHNNGPDGFIKLDAPDDRESFDYPTDKTISFEFEPLDSEVDVTYSLVLEAGGQQSIRRNARDTERFDIASLIGPQGLFASAIDPSGKLKLSWHVEAQLPRSLGNLPPIKSVTRTLTVTTPTNQAVEVDLAPASPSYKLGAPVLVNGSITDVNNLGDWEIQISYDPSLLTFTQGVKRGLFGSSTVFFNDAHGLLTISGSVPKGSAGLTGNGAIFQLTFTPVLPGRSEVAPTRVTLHDALGGAIQGRAGDTAEIGVSSSSTGGQSAPGGAPPGQPAGPSTSPQSSGGGGASLPALGPLMLVSPKNGDSVDYPGDRAVEFEYQELRTKFDVTYTLYMNAGGVQASKRDYGSGDPLPLESLLGRNGPFAKAIGPNGLDIDWHIEAAVDTGGAPVKLESETRRLSVKLPSNGTVTLNIDTARGKTRGISVGDPVFARGNLSSVDALGDWQITIDYDASVLSYTNGRKMGFFASSNVRFDPQGMGRLVISGSSPGAGLSGDGDCFELEFTAKGDGTTTIEADQVQLKDALGRQISANAGDSVDVEVIASSNPNGVPGKGKP